MPVTRASFRHLSVAALVCLAASGAAFAQPPADNTGTADFTVFVHGTRIGAQSVTLSRNSGGWTISSTGQLGSPFDLVVSKFEMRYSNDWHPQQLQLEGTLRGQPQGMTTSFGLTTAVNDLVQGAQHGSTTQQISPRAVVLPGSVFGAYEALAAQLENAVPGTRVPVYLAPEAETTVTVDRITPRHIVSREQTLDVREFALKLSTSGGLTPIEIWIDARHRLARIVMPVSSVVVLRDDLASALTREQPVQRPGDQNVFISSNGFSLGGTLSRPSGGPAKVPVVVMVSSPGPQGRDYASYGIPIVGELAAALFDAGHAVLRYDGRGVGQSGGRTESAGLTEYADDVLSIIEWLRKREDVDGNRVVLVGYAEAGPIALMAARRSDRVKGVALIAAPGRSGRDLTIEQQQQVLSTLDLPDAAKNARRAMQAAINDAVVTGRGWDWLPADVRRDADTVWFRTWLLFDPASVIKDLKQPLLIVHGSLDTEILPAHATRLEELARARKVPASATAKVTIAGANHLLIAAETGRVDEYVSLPARTVVPGVSTAIASWMRGLPGIVTPR